MSVPRSEGFLRAFHPYFERPLLPPLVPPAPIPGLAPDATPKRMTSEELEVELVESSTPYVDELMAKVRAEDERMRRLLPSAPEGFEWVGELQTGRPYADFTRNRGELVARLVYRLREVRP